MGRILAIDFGKKRCGLAVTDPLKIAANPLETVETPQLVNYVTAYCSREEVERIVVGKPTTMQGELSESNRWLLPAIGRLRKSLADKGLTCDIVFSDERFTSVLAHRAMLDAGYKKSDRQDKGAIDRMAAVIILNSYLGSIGN